MRGLLFHLLAGPALVERTLRARWRSGRTGQSTVLASSVAGVALFGSLGWSLWAHPVRPASLPPLVVIEVPPLPERPEVVVDTGVGVAVTVSPDGRAEVWRIPDQLAGIVDLGNGLAEEIYASGYRRKRAITDSVAVDLLEEGKPGYARVYHPDGREEIVDLPAPGTANGKEAVILRPPPPPPPPPVAPGTPTGTFGWPIRGPITQGFWWWHQGIDIACTVGAPVIASEAGVITYSNWDGSGYGMRVVAQSGNHQHTYSHLSRLDVRVGQAVNKGQTIGTCGSTGRSTGPHLHFEVVLNGRYLNPLGLLR